ncbi:expressed unknown protein [Seminavis robusta]|uniref:Glyoxalase-like domain-containing protein n=1 Tax=Seminavis robusta TaxID=568900 RepID=A0A9N8EWJ9_9STRA|nr:expressed unknown protein [Seminavis robusta]|eukprot:Sro1912_g304980.1 n/a (608) ;mRNA; f:8940-10763
MINTTNKDETEMMFSWEDFREERLKSDKEEKRRRRQSKTKGSKEKKHSKKKHVIITPENKPRGGGGGGDAFYKLLDASDRTDPTLAESASTLSSLPEDLNGSSFLGQFLDDDAQEDEASNNMYAAGLDEDNIFDHVVLAAPELDSAILEFERKTGVRPIKTGHINGLGITKARVAFHGSSFLEIIAPDDKPGPTGDLLRSAGITGLTPFHWAIRNSGAEALVSQAKSLGYTPDFISMKGPGKDGSCKQWEELYLYGHSLGGVCPFFINWDTFDHPCETLPAVGNLLEVSVAAPADDVVHKLIERTSPKGFMLSETAESHFRIKFDSPKGEVTFAADEMTGFKIPGFGDAVPAKKSKPAAPVVKAPSADNKASAVEKPSADHTEATPAKKSKPSTKVEKKPSVAKPSAPVKKSPPVVKKEQEEKAKEKVTLPKKKEEPSSPRQPKKEEPKRRQPKTKRLSKKAPAAVAREPTKQKAVATTNKAPNVQQRRVSCPTSPPRPSRPIMSGRSDRLSGLKDLHSLNNRRLQSDRPGAGGITSLLGDLEGLSEHSSIAGVLEEEPKPQERFVRSSFVEEPTTVEEDEDADDGISADSSSDDEWTESVLMYPVY